MLSEPVRGLMEPAGLVTAPPQATVAEVSRLMLEHGIGTIVVVENGSPTGIFTERDAVLRVIAQGRDARSVSVGEVMTRQPLTIDPETTFGRALVLMHEHGLRHLPVVEGGKLIGIVSARDALDPELEDFISEERRRESFR
jgi:CBS domain-containing protein